MQERLGQQIADHLNDMMEPHGVAVHLEAAHLCTQPRGVREERSRTTTSFWRGNYERDPEMRREFLTVAQRAGDWSSRSARSRSPTIRVALAVPLPGSSRPRTAVRSRCRRTWSTAIFVTSIDGVAAIEGVKTSSATISGGEPTDRFVMAVLRGVADAVVVGSGTLKEHAGPWTAEKAFPLRHGRVPQAPLGAFRRGGADARGRDRERRAAGRSLRWSRTPSS